MPKGCACAFTTIPIHKEIMRSPIFRRGQMYTDFIPRLIGEMGGDKNAEEAAPAKTAQKEKVS